MRPRVTDIQKKYNKPVLKNLDPKQIIDAAWEFIEQCENFTEEVATPRGAIEIKRRKIPTRDYFLSIWLKRKGIRFYAPSTFSEILKCPDAEAYELCRDIDELFKSLAVDIVANEAKGIFWAKNALGMTDRVDTNVKSETTFTGLEVTIKSSGLPPASSESEVPM